MMCKTTAIKNVGEFKRIIPTFIFLLITLTKGFATNYVIPDFAFPETVEKQNKELLQQSLREGNQKMALRGLMNLVITDNLLQDQNDSLESILTLTNSVTNELTGIYHSLGLLLEAEILNQAYEGNKAIYDGRKLPLDGMYPSNPTEWSGEMFKLKILELIESATAGITEKSKDRIEEISPLISNYETAKKIGLDVPEFISFKSIGILKNFISFNSITTIPFYPTEQNNTIEGKSKKKIRQLINDISQKLAGDNTIVKSLAVLENLSLINDFEKENYLKKEVANFKGASGEGIILYELWRRYPDNSSAFYDEIKEWLEKFPETYGNENLRYVLAEMGRERIDVTFPRTVLSNETINTTVTLNNMDRGYILIYKLAEGESTIFDELILKKFNFKREPDRIYEVSGSGTVPFSFSKEISVSGLQPGLYAVVPSGSKKLDSNRIKATSNANYSTFRVTDIAILTSFESNMKDSGRVYVVNGSNQQPIEGAVVSYYKGDSKTAQGRLITNSEGFVNAPTGYYRIEATYGKNKARREGGFSYYPENERRMAHASILTDLAVYRPGDTIKFGVVGWMQERLSNSLLQNCKIRISLRDVNYNEIDSLCVTLNDQGRANGKIVIDKGRLLGNYQLVATFPDMKDGGGATGVLVEEYKLPSFLVTLRQEASSDSTMITLAGTAKTFAGMPLDNTETVIRIEFAPWFRGFMGNKSDFQTTTTTDNEGNFFIELPTAGLKGTIFERGRYVATASVTSSSGETEKSVPLNFFLGNAYEIRPSLRDKTEIKGDSIKLNIPVYDIANLPVSRDVEYKIKNLYSDKDSITGSFTSPILMLPSSKLQSGKYSLEFRTYGNDDTVSTETVFWRNEETIAPYPSPLWVPKTEYVYENNEKETEITFGSYWEDWIFCVVSDGTRTLETKWLKPQRDLQRMKVAIPEGNSTLFVTLSGMHNLASSVEVINIVPKQSKEHMEMETISFRDNITANNEETWTFKFKTGNKVTKDVNVFAVMTDKALNSISDFRWHLNIWKPGVYSKVHLTSPYSGFSSSYEYMPLNYQYSRFASFNPVPCWETYGYPFVSRFGRGIYERMAFKAMATSRNAMDGAVIEETALEMEDSARGETGGMKEREPKEIELRPVEMPVAFFMPDITGNNEGEVHIKFRVPNFNTTWQLQLAAYDEKLNNIVEVLDATASKPVMIKSNLPQYLRTGDRAEISAVIYNNSQDTIPISGRLQIMNPITGEIIYSQEYEEENIAPSLNRIVTISFLVPDNLNILSFRGYGISKGNNDGEQGFIPVLPSSAPVTEATVFYANSKDDRVELKIPRLNEKANVTLKYCDNPLWEVLLSLPSMTNSDNPGSLSIARWLYGTILSSHIISSNSEISEGLNKIINSEDSAISLSNLQKDENVKIVALNATPWVNDASSETRRIRGLKNYLDEEETERLIDSKIESLKKLQMSDGGFSWFEGMKSSPFITLEIIRLTGYLNAQGLLTPDLKEISRKAVKYYDNYLEELYKKIKDKRNTISFSLIQYFYARNMVGLGKSSIIKKIESEMLDSITSQWKYWDPVQKAMGGILLANNPKYRPEANRIAESISQFLGRRIPVNQEALILEFLEIVSPDSQDIEKVKEKMLLQKEAEKWGSENLAAIYSLVKSDKGLNINRTIPELLIDGSLMVLPESQTLTGNFTINLDPKKVSGKKLTIKRSPGVPSWGGVISQYIKPINQIKAESCENISVEKRVLLENADGEIKTAKKYKKGDKVRVTLNLNVKKNMDYVVIRDSRAACLQPDTKISGITMIDGLLSYQEIRSDKTSFFIEHLPAGNYVISYDCHADRDGVYSLGITEVQSLYSPIEAAHSAGNEIEVFH